MKSKRLVWATFATILALSLPALSFAQGEPLQNRIPQQVIINGQRFNGAYAIRADGGLQSFTCPAPQPYNSPDGASHGWACFDAASGVWLLNAVPPSPQPVQQAPIPVYQQPPTVIYQQPPTVIYQQPVPATVVYTTPAPVVVAPVYRDSVVLGVAAINATGRILSAAIRGSRYPHYVYYGRPGRRRW